MGRAKAFVTGGAFLCLLLATEAISQVGLRGGRGLWYVSSAETVGWANLYVNGLFRGYYVKEENATVLTKDQSFFLNVTYGLSNSIEFVLNTVPYQDDQRSIWGPPGDTRAGLKVRLPFSGKIFHTGLQGFVILPTAKNANVPFEPFSSGKVGAGAMALFTVDLAPSLPLFPIKFHTNVGYIDHSLNDSFFSAKIDQLFVGFGLKFPLRSTVLYSEVSGEFFINNSEQVKFSENSIRVTEGIRFLGPMGLVVDIGADIGVSSDPSFPFNSFQKEYANWRVQIGVTYSHSFAEYFRKRDRLARQRRLEEEAKLRRIKEQRERAGEDLEKMKKALEKDGKGKKP
jgi:hypothetical protein